MMEAAAVIEIDVERDRKACLALDLKVSGANRELAQWLIDHPRYPATIVASWLGCGQTRIKELRRWAEGGFVKSPARERMERADRRRAADAPLETLNNSEQQVGADEEVADPATVEDNALHTLARMSEHARVFKKIFKLSSFDREAELRIITAIDRMIEKWRSTQATLTRRKRDNV